MRPGDACSTLDGTQIRDEPVDLLRRLPMRRLVVYSVAEELVAPHGHVPRTVARKLCLSVDDPEYLELREFAVASSGDPAQIRDLNIEQWRNGTEPIRIDSMTARAGHAVQPHPFGDLRLRRLRSARRICATGKRAQRQRQHGGSNENAPVELHALMVRLPSKRPHGQGCVAARGNSPSPAHIPLLKILIAGTATEVVPYPPDTGSELSKTLRLQDDLFTSEATSPASTISFAAAKRVALDEHSWVEVVPGWLSGSHLLFERLEHAVPWKQHDRRLFDQTFREPRLTAEYRHLRDVPENALLETVRALSQHYGVVYDSPCG